MIVKVVVVLANANFFGGKGAPISFRRYQNMSDWDSV